MRIRSFEQNIALMPDGMAKQILLKIMNTPKPDYQKMDRECEVFVEDFLSKLTDEEKKQYEVVK